MQFPLQLRRLTAPPALVHSCVQDTAFGLLLSQWLVEEQHVWLCGQQFISQEYALTLASLTDCPDPRWLQALQADQSVSFEAISVAMYASDFQWQVWQALTTIPFATTCCYQDIAQQIQNPQAVRAVATAIGQNPIAYLIPCHRVLRRDGGMGGYRWGVALKQQLLDWERGHIT